MAYCSYLLKKGENRRIMDKSTYSLQLLRIYIRVWAVATAGKFKYGIIDDIKTWFLVMK